MGTPVVAVRSALRQNSRGGSMAVFVGTAGRGIGRELWDLFGPGPNHLARYAGRFNAVEINSSFYKPHREATYARWASSVPAGFRFAVKLPRAITHERGLAGSEVQLDSFLSQVNNLGVKLGPLLMQLPPSLAYDAPIADRFLAHL